MAINWIRKIRIPDYLERPSPHLPKPQRACLTSRSFAEWRFGQQRITNNANRYRHVLVVGDKCRQAYQPSKQRIDSFSRRVRDVYDGSIKNQKPEKLIIQPSVLTVDNEVPIHAYAPAPPIQPNPGSCIGVQYELKTRPTEGTRLIPH